MLVREAIAVGLFIGFIFGWAMSKLHSSMKFDNKDED
jgi:hypothetical protein